MMKTFTVAKAASKGIVMGKAFVAVQEDLTADTRSIKDSEREMEWLKFQKAVKDTVLHDSVELKINSENKNAQLALEETVAEIVTMFESLDDEYLRERAADIKDVGKRIMCGLKGIKSNPFEGISEDVIVVAEDLAPSDTANMDFRYIKGFITEAGKNVTNEDYIILDAVGKEIIVNPDEETKEAYRKKAAEYKAMKAEFESMNNLPATTTDGRTVELFANVGSIVDVENAVTRGAEGIGLFRSEFLYMENTKFPTEQEQYDAYKKAIETMKHPVIIRTLDIGGDKDIPYMGLTKESNPFLGYRAIRFCLGRIDVFTTQLRAILRASAYGNIRIMLPLITGVSEVRSVRTILQNVMRELDSKEIPYDKDILLGVMIETPAACMLADILAKEADFFSIGTNDLTQYTIAVDRGNENVAYLYSAFHPAVLRSVKRIIECAKRENIEVGMCGEAAGNPAMIPLLLAFGLDEFSVTASKVLETRKNIASWTMKEAAAVTDTVMGMSTEKEVSAYLSDYIATKMSNGK